MVHFGVRVKRFFLIITRTIGW